MNIRTAAGILLLTGTAATAWADQHEALIEQARSAAPAGLGLDGERRIEIREVLASRGL